MSIFKKKIDFKQFLADLITFQYDFLENNFNKLVTLADESKMLTEQDKKEFLDKANELIIVDISMSCYQHLYKNLSSEEAGKAASVMYGRYLMEYKKIPKSLAEKRVESAMKLLELACKAEENAQRRSEQNKKIGYVSPFEIDNDLVKQKIYLCTAFSIYCAGEDVKSENWAGRRFAAFKLAKGFVKADIVKHALKEFKINWN